MKINDKFANSVIFPRVKKNENYDKFVDANGVERTRKFVKVDFLSKKTSHKPGSNQVVCNIDCCVRFDVPFYWMNALTEQAYFHVVGVAVCSEDDKFDLGKGKLIAQAKAENEAYKVGKNMLATIQQQLFNFAQALYSPIEQLDNYKAHNDKFIGKVIDGEIKPKE